MSDITTEIFLPLYKVLVRPIIEYCSSVWSPMLMKDKIEIEKVQRRATKTIRSLSHLSYSERLYHLNLDSLHFRRRRADMIQVFRIIKGFDKIPVDICFAFNSNDRTRGHRYKIFKNNVRTNTRLNAFSQRIINDWNSLSVSTTECESINSFKTALKREWANHPEKYDMP
jgi:hypothetical protein